MSRASIAPSFAAVALIGLLAACSSSPQAGAPSDADGPSESATTQVAIASNYYPVAEGNTWTYSMTYPAPIGIVTETETMSSVKPDGEGGATVTIDRSFHYENGSTADFGDAVTYVFHADGSLEVPYQTVPSSDAAAVVTVVSGTMIWPSDAEFEAGTVKSGDITASVASGGAIFDETVHFEISGGGVESVTVPYGTVDARKLVQALTVSIPQYGIDLPIAATSWLQKDVGLVRTEIPDFMGGAPITVELVEFTAGG